MRPHRGGPASCDEGPADQASGICDPMHDDLMCDQKSSICDPHNPDPNPDQESGICDAQVQDYQGNA